VVVATGRKDVVDVMVVVADVSTSVYVEVVLVTIVVEDAGRVVDCVTVAAVIPMQEHAELSLAALEHIDRYVGMARISPSVYRL